MPAPRWPGSSRPEVTIRNKCDASKWQAYTVANTPVDASGYVEFPVVWLRGNGTVPEQRTLISAIAGGVTVNVTPIPPLHASSGHVEIDGQLIIFDFAHPFVGANYISPGLTKRQWYAGQAMTGFIAASNVSAANLVGRLAAFCFTAANSMIAYEQNERNGYQMPMAGADRNAPATPVTPPETAPAQQAILQPPPPSPTVKAAWPRKIIS